MHFSRFRVTQIGLSNEALQQFDLEPILAAADLLGDARPSSITWNGTSAGWLGFDSDTQLCAAVTEKTGVPAYTSVLALNEILQLSGARRLALVSPYVADVQQRIAANYASLGIECVAERHLDLHDNFSFARVEPATLRAMAAEAAMAKPDAIAIYCTNLAGAPIAAELEDALGIPVYDTVATAVWKALRGAGADVSRLARWGSLFRSGL